MYEATKRDGISTMPEKAFNENRDNLVAELKDLFKEQVHQDLVVVEDFDATVTFTTPGKLDEYVEYAIK